MRLIDARKGIGPHHLGIGKTRKLIDRGGGLWGYYGTGYGYQAFLAPRNTLEAFNSGFAYQGMAWGGGQFCVDDKGVVAVARGRRELIVHEQKIAGAQFNAPWVSGDWYSAVVGTQGKFLVGYKDKQKLIETDWWASCLMVLPVSETKAWLCGFVGRFPVEMELVVAEIDSDLNVTNELRLGLCGVNDVHTFHFQGLSREGFVSIVYLSPDAHVMHAVWKGGMWSVTPVGDFPSIAPQNTELADGSIGILCADYKGQIWRLDGDKPRAISEPGLVNLHPVWSRTQYGTGGISAAAKSTDQSIPYLAVHLPADAKAPSELYLGLAGEGVEGTPYKMPKLTEEFLPTVCKDPDRIPEVFRRLI